MTIFKPKKRSTFWSTLGFDRTPKHNLLVIPPIWTPLVPLERLAYVLPLGMSFLHVKLKYQKSLK